LSFYDQAQINTNVHSIANLHELFCRALVFVNKENNRKKTWI